MKKVIAALMLVIAFVSCSWAWNVGSGTEDDPYVIKDASDFSYFRYMVNDGRDDEGCYYLLSNDIQLTRQVRVAPVGVEEHPFTGHFDGNGHIIYIKIMPLKDDDPNLISYDRALFGYVEASGNDYAIKNLNVAGYAGGYLAAGIASRLMSGDIQECTFTGDVEAMTITGDEESEEHLIHSGGIAANMRGGRIISCDFSGNVTTKGDDFYSYAGGIAGSVYAVSAKIQGCNVKHYSTIIAMGNEDSGNAKTAGGIVGYLEVEDLDSNNSDVTITSCTFEGGEISSDYSAGGIAGIVYGGILMDNTVGNDTRINGATFAGGVAGTLSAGALASSNNVEGGIVQANSRAAGGIVGLLELGEVTDNYSQASVRGDAVSKGGVVGEIHNHYGTTDNVTGNSYMGSGYAIGLDEHMNVNIDGENTRLDPVLYFEGSATLTPATENVQYREAITVSLPAVVDLTPIPSWLNPVQNGSTITLSGIPTETGTSTFTLTASYGYQTLSRTFSITVTPRLLISADSYVTAKIGDYVEIPLSVHANDYDISNASFTWSVEDGTLPSGLSLDETGSISGYVASPGTYDVAVQVTPENISLSPVTYSITIDVEPEITITTETLTSPIKVGREYSCDIGTDSSLPLLWSLSSGKLPDGLTLGTFTGYISGTPTTAGEYTFTLMASTGTVSADKEFTLRVEPAISITTASILPYAFLGEFYSQDISHDVPLGNHVQWTLSGADFPKGLSFDAGTISGIVDSSPDIAGDYAFNVKISTGAFSDSKDFELKVVGLFFSPDTLPSVIVGNEYSHDLRDYIDVYGVSEDLAFFTADAEDIPSGLSLDEDGLLYGTPQVSGTYTFPVSAVLYAFTVEKSCVLTILPMLSVIVPDALPSRVKAGEELPPCVFTVSPDVSPVTWSLGGSYPDGLTLGSLTGQLSGKVSTAGVFTFTVQATYGATTAESEFTLTVDPALMITTSSPLPYAFTGSEYSLTLSHDAPAGNTVTWAKISGDLPDGFTLSSDGTISGIANTAREYKFVVAASAGTFTVSKDFMLPVIHFAISSDSELKGGVIGEKYSFDLKAVGVAENLVTWSADNSLLPSGLELSTSGRISGTPTTEGSYTFRAFASSGDIIISKDLAITIYPALAIIEPEKFPARFKAGQSFSYKFSTDADNPENIYWSVSSGSLPSGLLLGNLTGEIVGTPTQSGTYTFTVQASNGAASSSYTMTLIIDPVLTITTASPLPYAFTGSEYSLTLSHDAPAGNTVTWEKVSGDLPDGFTLSGDGTISGLTNAGGEYTFTVKASAGLYTDSKDFTLTVLNVTLSFDTVLPDAAVSRDYSHHFQVNGVSANLITWSADLGAIPEGLTFYASGLLAGTPKESGSYRFLVSAFSGDITVSGYAKIDVLPFFNIAILTDRLPDATVNTRYSQVLSYDAPSGYVAKWEKVSGDLPSGFTLTEGGTISGVTSRTGSYSFRLKLTAGLTVSKDFTLRVLYASSDKEPVVIMSNSLPDGVIGEEYRAELIAVPETASWSNSGGITPPGLTLSADGVISGVPSVAGDFYFYATASHESYNSSTREYSIHIASSREGEATSGSSGGGGGCNSGGMMFLAGMLLFLRRKK